MSHASRKTSLVLKLMSFHATLDVAEVLRDNIPIHVGVIIVSIDGGDHPGIRSHDKQGYVRRFTHVGVVILSIKKGILLAYVLTANRAMSNVLHHHAPGAQRS